MVNNDIRLFEGLLTQFMSLRQVKMESVIKYSHHTVNYFTEKYNEIQKKYFANAKHLIEHFPDFIDKLKESNRLTSGDFNILRVLGVGETMHSYLIANLLSPLGEHGQGHLFLNIFLDELGIERLRNDENWIITVEKGRVDILLKRVAPHSVVIIENKSNYAIDQQNQLYRYWYQEIYNAIKTRNLSEEYLKNPPEKYYQLIYLTPAYFKVPIQNSLERPANLSADLPKLIPLEPRTLVFGVFITDWLELSLKKIPSENHRLREYVKQYIEIWR